MVHNADDIKTMGISKQLKDNGTFNRWISSTGNNCYANFAKANGLSGACCWTKRLFALCFGAEFSAMLVMLRRCGRRNPLATHIMTYWIHDQRSCFQQLETTWILQWFPRGSCGRYRGLCDEIFVREEQDLTQCLQPRYTAKYFSILSAIADS